MASRRIVSTEKTALDRDDQPEGKSDISPAVPSSVLWKLIGFTFAMITVPIGSYYLSVHSIFRGNASYAGGFAAVVANVVLIAYIIVAMREDESERHAKMQPESKKDR